MWGHTLNWLMSSIQFINYDSRFTIHSECKKLKIVVFLVGWIADWCLPHGPKFKVRQKVFWNNLKHEFQKKCSVEFNGAVLEGRDGGSPKLFQDLCSPGKNGKNEIQMLVAVGRKRGLILEWLLQK